MNSFLIVASPRSGGTFLARCLSNHTEVFCLREGPLSGKTWSKIFPETALRLALQQEGYAASGCKICGEALATSGAVRELKPRVLFLTRADKTQQAASWLLTRQGRVAHTTTAVSPPTERLRIKEVREAMRELKEIEKTALELIKRLGFPCMLLAYTDLVGVEGAEVSHVSGSVSNRICCFLGVTTETLFCSLHKVNPSLRDFID